MATPKNPHAVKLGRKGGRATTDRKRKAARFNLARARQILKELRALDSTKRLV